MDHGPDRIVFGMGAESHCFGRTIVASTAGGSFLETRFKRKSVVVAQRLGVFAAAL